MKFDHKKFFDLYRAEYGSMNQSQVDGIESLLTSIESDAAVTDVRWAAYMLATTKHECADKWQPIEEYGKGSGKEYGKPVTVVGSDGMSYTNTYYGRGYVQLTWKDNYDKMSKNLDLSDQLLIKPALALDPPTAYEIMSYGMRKGSFTGKKLADYIHDQTCDYKNARRIINGTDQADKIKGYAQKLESFLNESMIPQASAAGG
ncbi:MAG TPA: hypothetical protein VJZ91_03870 [Blastocatellia bacterium]|nr:hypothetical protein [Blastocatellia bacterium]